MGFREGPASTGTVLWGREDGVALTPWRGANAAPPSLFPALGMWVPAGQAIGKGAAAAQCGGRAGGRRACRACRARPHPAYCVPGGYGPPPAGRGAPPPPPPFTSYIVSTPPGGFPPPQGFPQGYGAPPQFSESQALGVSARRHTGVGWGVVGAPPVSAPLPGAGGVWLCLLTSGPDP